MRLENWNPDRFDEEFENVTKERLIQAAEVLAAKVRTNLKAQIGKGKTTGINRPVYKKGKYTGELWTSRHFGRLLKSIRVTQRKSKRGYVLWRKRNIRVYAGHYLAYYASIFEFTRPFMRPAFWASIPEIKSILGVR